MGGRQRTTIFLIKETIKREKDESDRSKAKETKKK